LVYEDLNETEECDQPEWMDLVKPLQNFDMPIKEFEFDDGGPECNWNQPSFNYPETALTWSAELPEVAETHSTGLNVPDVNINYLNDDQLFVFNIVMKTLLDYTQNPDNFTPLRIIIGGTAGCGKSFLIRCLVKAIRLYFNSRKSVQVLCPTGNSAHVIDGATVHSFLKIPTVNRGKEMIIPDGKLGESLQRNCEGLKVLLFDERSMIGATNLGWIEFMCRCGVANSSNADTSWGGLPVVAFFGDDVQLPPVLDSPVYFCQSKLPAAMHGVLVWQEFTHAVLLEKVIRQSESEKYFKNVLYSLREYNLTKEQAQWLQKYQWHSLRQHQGQDFLDRVKQRGFYVFPTHEQEWKHNKAKIMALNKSFPIAKIDAMNYGFHAKQCPSDKASGLLPTLYLCRQAKVMLTVNLCVPFGLFNGAMGFIVDILYHNGKPDPGTLPDVITVEFPSYTGPPFIQESPKLIPIVPVEKLIDCSCHHCRRKQIPLRLGWASTIHKCQGLTIGAGETNRYIVISPGTTAFESRNPGALFVALSRAKSAGTSSTDPDFAWHENTILNEDRLCHVVSTPTTKARHKEIARLRSLHEKTTELFSYLQNDKQFINIFNQM